MGKKSQKPAPGQKGLTKDFATVERQLKIRYQQDAAAAQTKTRRDNKPFSPGPNRELGAFIRQYATPYDPKHDKYDVPAFDRDITVDKAAPPKAIYDMHTYWSKKHWAAIRQYISHYLPERFYPRGTGLMLDCFSGSGMTGVAAMMEDRPCVLMDASPAAAFISHCYTHPVEPEKFHVAFDRMMSDEYPVDLKNKLRAISGREINSLPEELDWLYETRCDVCGGKAMIEYVVYSERFQCIKCNKIVPLFDCAELKVPYLVGGVKKQKTELKKRRVCPYCLQRADGQPHRDFVISTRAKKFGAIPVLISYQCLGGCSPERAQRRHTDPQNTRKGRFFLEYDLAKLADIERATIPHWFPDRKMMDVEDDSKPWGMEWRPGRNFRSIAQLYTKRNLWALGATLDAARASAGDVDHVRLGVVSVALGLSRMNRYVPNHYSFQNQILAGTYYIPMLGVEIDPRSSWEKKSTVISRALAALAESRADAGSLVACCDSSSSQFGPPDSSLDYIFTDPAYVDKVQYGELNFVWESWLGFSGDWLKDEVVVNPLRGKTLEDWDRDLRRALANCFAALKPGRWLSLCYHDTDPATWTRVQNMLLDSGFEIHTVTVLDPKQKSSNQLTAEKVVKSDLVLNCRKPRPGETSRDGSGGETGQVSRRVRDILVETLSHVGGQARDRLWDVVLRRLLTRGQMAEHRFDDILSEVAFRSESGRWFLKEEFEALSHSDIKNEEAAGESLLRFARLRCAGVPVNFAAQIALVSPRLADGEIDETAVESHIRAKLIEDKVVATKFELGGRMRGVEFYDCLFFYLTRFLKGRPAGQTPRRNLAEFLEEYLVRFKDGDKWLYRTPNAPESEALRKSRQTGLGRRIRQYVAYLRGEGDFPEERRPDPKTAFAWLKHCANFGLADEGVLLFDRGGMAGMRPHLSEDEWYDAQDYAEQCRRKASRDVADEDQDFDAEDGDVDAEE